MSKLPKKSSCFNFPNAIAPVFAQPGVTLIQHGASKFEIRFRPPAKNAAFMRVVSVGLVVLLALVCAVGAAICFGFGVGTILLVWLPIMAIPAIVLRTGRGVFHRFFAERLFGDCHARGIICNASLLTFTVWSRLNDDDKTNTTIPFTDVLDVVLARGNVLCLATRDGRFHPFTRPIHNPDAATALRGFIKNLTTLDTSVVSRWQPADPPPPTDPKILYEKRHGSTPLRFSKRADRKSMRITGKKYFEPPS